MTKKINKKENMEKIWKKVEIARAFDRATSIDYINAIFDNFIEFAGDRYGGNDDSIIGGVGMLGDRPVTIIGQQKGRNTEENIKRNFGMPSPEGYRKSLRLMKQAEKFGRPIINFIDTPGAYPGIEAEEHGQGEAIARNLMEMSQLEVPIISIIIGEGGSGGALALAVADRVWMLENSIFSILSPEGFATIIWKDVTRKKEAASIMKLTAPEIKKMKLIEKVISEPKLGVMADSIDVFNNIKELLIQELKPLDKLTKAKLLKGRYERFRGFGRYVK